MLTTAWWRRGNKPPESFALEMSLPGVLNTIWIGLETVGPQPKAVCHLSALSREIMKNNVQLMSQAIHHSDSDGFQGGLKWVCFLLLRNILEQLPASWILRLAAQGEGDGWVNIEARVFPQHFIMENFKQTEKLEELPSEHSYTHYLHTIIILWITLSPNPFTYLFVHSQIPCLFF